MALAHLLCLTFDFDAVSPWINRGQTSPTSLSIGRGHRLLVLERLIDGLNELGAPGSFAWTKR